MTHTEFERYRSINSIKSFVNKFEDLRSKTVPEITHKAHYINNVVSSWGNIAILRKICQEHSDRVHIYLYKGVAKESNLPTLRGTLLKSKDSSETKEKAIVMLMPERAPGTCSMPVIVDDYYNKVSKEIRTLRPVEIQNIEDTLLSFTDEISTRCEKWEYMTRASVNDISSRINRVMDNKTLEPIAIVKEIIDIQENIKKLEPTSSEKES